MSNKKKKPEAPKQGELVKLTNGMLDGFVNNPSITRLRQLKGLREGLRFKIFRLWETIVNSPEHKALNETKSVILKEYNENQAKLKEKDRTPLTFDNPKIQELFEMDSGLEIRKPIVPNNQLSGEFTPFDMNATSWIIQYEEGE